MSAVQRTEDRSKFLLGQLEGEWSRWDTQRIGRAVKRARSLPIEVRTEGLSTAVAVLLAERRPESTALAELIAGWLLGEGGRRIIGREAAPRKEAAPQKDARALLGACIRAERAVYQALQAETLALLDQLKLLADALYGDQAEQVGDAE